MSYGKLIIWIVVSSFIGGLIWGLLDAAHLDIVAEYWSSFYHVMIGVGIGYFIFRD